MLFLELQPLQKKDFVMVFTVMGPARPRLEDLETLNLISMYFFFELQLLMSSLASVCMCKHHPKKGLTHHNMT